MSMISDLVDRLRAESKSMGKYGTDYMATLLMEASDTIVMLSEKARADRPNGKWIGADTQCGIACSVCGVAVDDFCHSTDYIDLDYNPNFCPHCGADLRGED